MAQPFNSLQRMFFKARLFGVLSFTVFAFWLLQLPFALSADEVTSDTPEKAAVVYLGDGGFQGANTLYAAGDYTGALEQYRRVIAEKGPVSEVYFNMGNACMKLKQKGRAKLYYLRALQLDPRDGDVRKNLEYVEKLIDYRIEDKSGAFRRVLRQMSSRIKESEIHLAFQIFLLVLLLTFWASLRGKMGRVLGFLKSLTFSGLCLIVACFLIQKVAAPPGNPAVVIAKEATLRYGPSAEDKKLFQLGEGMDVFIVDARESWSRVVLLNQETGWLPNEAIKPVASADEWKEAFDKRE